MNLALLFAPVLFIGVVVYIAWPFFSGQGSPESTEGAERWAADREQLLHEKEEVLTAIKDIEMDFRMGKLTEEDFSQLRADFEQRAFGVFRRLDALGESVPGAANFARRKKP